MEENIVIHKPSVIPYYSVGLFWLGYAVVFPLYRLIDFGLVGGLSMGLFVLLKKVIPPQTITIARPIETGDTQMDEMIREGTAFLHQLRNHKTNIDNTTMQAHMQRMETSTIKIFQYVQQHPNKRSSIRRFMNYYLPTVGKLLSSYDQLEEQQLSAQSIQETMHGIEKVMGQAADAFDHQLEGLFTTQTMDIASEIKVLEHMIQNEGLFPSEFEEIMRKQERTNL